MAKKCMIARDKVRLKKSQSMASKRKALKAIISNPDADYDEKMTAIAKLSGMSRDTSPCRHRRRCRNCGRPRATLRKFGMCRICLRNSVMFGLVPGVVKSSW